jgi:hypothetical protein
MSIEMKHNEKRIGYENSLKIIRTHIPITTVPVQTFETPIGSLLAWIKEFREGFTANEPSIYFHHRIICYGYRATSKECSPLEFLTGFLIPDLLVLRIFRLRRHYTVLLT